MIGQLIDRRYRIMKVLCSGSVGQTYLAADTRRPGYPQCIVREFPLAGKNPETPEIIKLLFKRKAEIIEKLGQNDRIPELLASFEENQSLYLVEDFIVGEPLTQELVPGKPFSEEKVTEFLAEVLEILTQVHEQGIVHQNVTPNHLIRRQSDGKLVLIDFGLDAEIKEQIQPGPKRPPQTQMAVADGSLSKSAARQTLTQEPSDDTSPSKPLKGSRARSQEAVEEKVTDTPEGEPSGPLTASAAPVDTPLWIYLPPESLEGHPKPHYDLYAVGMIAIQAITGLPPEELLALRNNNPQNLGELLWRHQVSCSPGLADILDKMVHYNGDERYQSTSEVLAALEALRTIPLDSAASEVSAATTAETSQKSALGQKLKWIILSLITLLITLGGVFYFFQNYYKPQMAKILETRAAEKVKQKDFAGAVKDYNQAIQLNSKNADTYYYKRANVYYDWGELNRALQDYTEAIQRNSGNKNSYYNRGLIYAETGDQRKAVEDFTQVIRLEPTDADAYYQRGIAYYDLEDYRTAIEDFTQAIRLHPNDANIYSSRGLARSAAGDKQGAMADFTQAIRINPDDAGVYYSRGRARFNLADYKGAVEDYAQAIALDPNNADAYTNRCSANLNLAEHEAAIDDCTRAIQLNPRDWAAYNNRCIAHLNRGDYQQAAEDCSITIGINNKNSKAYSNRGLARSATGNKPGAIEDFTEAIRLNPNDAVAYGNRGITYAETGDYSKAIEDYAQSIRLNPNNPTAYYSRGLVRRQLKDQPGAIQDFQKAATLFLEQGRADDYKKVQDEMTRIQ